MKKIIAMLLSLLLVLSMAACGADSKGDGSTLLFDYKDLGAFISAPEYKGYKLDTESEAFDEALTNAYKTVLTNYKLQEEVEVASGTVMEGDVAHIVYVGKINGEEFNGGSSGDKGTDLEIGSGQFIDGFESGLVGKKIGSTVVLDLTFPETYHNADVAGKPVEFTVEIQTVKRTVYPEVTDEIAKKMGYESLEEYETDVFTNTARQFIARELVKQVTVKISPEKEIDFFVNTDIDYYKKYYGAMGVTIETVTGMTESALAAQLRADYVESAGELMFMYYVAKNEGLTVKSADLDAKIKELAAQSKVTVEEFLGSNKREYIELSMIYESVMNFLLESAEILPAE